MNKKFVENGMLQYNTMHYPFQLENISSTGVVVRLKEEASEPILPGGDCVLVLYNNHEKDRVTVSARLVHYSFTLAALQFIELDGETERVLGNIVEKVAGEKKRGKFNSSGLHHHLGITTPEA